MTVDSELRRTARGRPNPAISCCFSGRIDRPAIVRIGSDDPTVYARLHRKLICLFFRRRTRFDRVNFNMSATRAAALLSWYARIECMSGWDSNGRQNENHGHGNSKPTMLKPWLRLRRVPKMLHSVPRLLPRSDA